MYTGSFDHGKIIEAFRRNVPGCYIRDYRDNNGFITICRDYKDIRWGDQLDAGRRYVQVPAVTLANLPRGYMTRATIYHGLRLHRPGWHQEFERASRHLSEVQMRGITEFLGAGEVFQGIN